MTSGAKGIQKLRAIASAKFFSNKQSARNAKLVSSQDSGNFVLDNGNLTYLVTDFNARIFTGSGNNVVMGADGNDTLVGQKGNDTIAGGAGDDIIIGNGDAKLSAVYDAQAIKTQSTAEDYYYIFDRLKNSSNDANLNGYRNRGSDIMAAGDGNDWVIATGKDTVSAGNGNDFVYTSGRDALIYADNGNDTVYSIGTGTIDGGNGDDFILVYDPSDVDTTSVRQKTSILGGNGNDTIVVNSLSQGNFAIDGGKGNDLISLRGSGNFSVTGGGDNDFIDASRLSTLSSLSVSGGNGNDVVKGSAGADTINAGAGNDTIDAGEGNDIIYAGSGTDLINAGGGDDYISIDLRTNSPPKTITLDGAQGSDRLYIRAVGNNALIAYLNNIKNNFSTNKPDSITVNGTTINLKNFEKFDFWVDIPPPSVPETNPGDKTPDTIPDPNVIFGAKTSERLDYSGKSNNRGYSIYGGGGSDTIVGSSASDYLNIKAGASSVNGGDGDDRIDLTSSSAASTFTAMIDAPSDKGYFIQPAGTYRLLDNTVDGGKGNDSLAGTAFNDAITLFDGSGRQLLSNIEYLDAGGGNDIVSLIGGPASSWEGFIVNGGGGDDTLIGGNGNASLYGERGNDLLVSGKGSEYLKGDLGNNTYMYLTNSGLDQGNDTIIDFNSSRDTLILDRNLFGNNGDGYRDANLSLRNNSVVLDFPGDGLNGLSKGSITFKFSGLAKAQLAEAQALFDRLRARDVSILRYMISANGTGGDEQTQTGTNYNDNIILNNGSFSANGNDGNDFIDATLASGSTLNGASGSTLNGSAGIDTLVGGSGDDDFVFTVSAIGAESTITNMDIVKGFASNDRLSFNITGNRGASGAAPKVYNGQAAYLLYFMENDQATTAYRRDLFNTDGSGGYSPWKQVTIQNDSYVFVDANSNGVFDGGSDIVVKLENYNKTLTSNQISIISSNSRI